MHIIIGEAIKKIINSLPKPTKVLEVGATINDTLLLSPVFDGCKECVGINIDATQIVTGSVGDTISDHDYSIKWGSGHAIDYPDNYFDLVICNSVLEHDPYFWLTLVEMKRVLSGYLVIGVPAFIDNRVLGVHRYPKDYYRFGEDAVREVFFGDIELCGLQILMPEYPRIVAWGRK